MNRNEQAELVFHALADGNRLMILEKLSQGELNAGEVLEQVDIVQSTLSHHMKTLCEAQLVHARRQGKWTYYSLNREAFEEGAEYLSDIAQAASKLPAVESTEKKAEAKSSEKKTSAKSTEKKAVKSTVKKAQAESTEEASVAAAGNVSPKPAKGREEAERPAEVEVEQPVEAEEIIYAPVNPKAAEEESDPAALKKKKKDKSREKGSKDKAKAKGKEKEKGKGKEKAAKNKKKQ